MPDTTETLVERIDRYIEELFVTPDPTLDQNLRDAEAAGLPPINVSANEGKLLYLIAKIARAARVLEVGTLAGYSTTWLARALPPGGKVVTLEVDPKHAAVARKNLDRSVPGVDVDVRVGPASDLLRRMIVAREPPFDIVFIDADKPSYREYLDLSLELSHPGTVILADNVIRHGGVTDAEPGDENARAAKAFNDAIAKHSRLESIILPIVRERIDGLSISIVKP
jgi:caffeoyl-CoA O-methyltransferase